MLSFYFAINGAYLFCLNLAGGLSLQDLTASSLRVDAALRRLIGCIPQHRDRQLEVMCVRGLCVYLEGAGGWQIVQELGNFNVYYTGGHHQGTCAAEWVGGVVASDASGRTHIFLVEFSSTMDGGKVNGCRDRFARTLKHTASTVSIAAASQCFTQRLLQLWRRQQQPSLARLHCCIGGVVIESDAMNRARALNYGVIQQHDGNFEVVSFVGQ